LIVLAHDLDLAAEDDVEAHHVVTTDP